MNAVIAFNHTKLDTFSLIDRKVVCNLKWFASGFQMFPDLGRPDFRHSLYYDSKKPERHKKEKGSLRLMGKITDNKQRDTHYYTRNK